MTAGPITPAPRVGGIDTLRGLSALAVFLCHIGGYWTFLNLPGKLPQVLTLGTHGVDVFIVISGFCLMTPVVYSAGKLNARHFYGRRALRILPAYWVALAIAAVLAMSPATWSYVVARPASVSELAVHVVGMQTWLPQTLGTINGSLWSVSLEIQLYLVFPLLILLWRQRGWKLTLLLALSVAIAWELCAALTETSLLGDSHALPARLVQFVVGMWCAQVVVEGRFKNHTAGLSSLLAATLFIGSAAYTLNMPDPIRSTLWAGVGASAIILVSAVQWRGRWVGPLEHFGSRSFSFYLLHQPALLMSAPLVALIPGGWLVQFAVGGTLCLAMTYGLATVLYRVVELPSHIQGRRLFPRVTPRRVNASTEPV